MGLNNDGLKYQTVCMVRCRTKVPVRIGDTSEALSQDWD